VASVIEEVQRAGVLVFAIYTPGVGHYGHSYWRSHWGQLYLSHVADETGGQGYYIGFSGPPVSFVPSDSSVPPDVSREAPKEGGIAASEGQDRDP
jgi:hypothetical protein